MKSLESEEMYLETILLLKKRMANVRSVNIVEELDYAKSSVSRGVNLLVKKGYVTMDHSTGDIEFTEKGQARADAIYDRHETLTRALVIIGADESLAEQNACRIEHVISEEMFVIIKDFVNKHS